MTKTSGRPFLTARWEHLVILNYEAPPSLIEPLVPAGTELDDWRGATLVSLVGFSFLDTRLRGLPIPFHRNFPEVNLRFYVRRTGPDGALRRAVVFIREIVPVPAVAYVAKWVYNEPYATARMRSHVACDAERGGRLEYRWRYGQRDCAIAARVSGPATPLAPDSEASFVAEHYWGYTRQRDGGTLEYRVEHPPWSGWRPDEASFAGDTRPLYGDAFAELLSGPARSAFVARGSAVAVHAGRRIAKAPA